ncbi:MAG: hypothetical protein U0270_34275 [Labilithrix sp.]
MLRGSLLAAVGFAAIFASTTGCDAPANELSDGRSRVGGSHGASSDDDDSATGDDDDVTSSSTSSASSKDAKTLFQAVQPKLSQSCGPCHTLGSNAAPIWMDPSDPYGSIKAYKGIVVPDADASILLTKPAHDGPAIAASLAPAVKAWLTAETASATAPAATTATTNAIAIPNGATGIDLPAPGGRITFTASFASEILTLKDVALAAPTGAGVHASGVHIDIVHADNSKTTNDSLADADTTAAAGATAPLGVGLVVIPRVNAGDKIAIRIDAFAPATGTTAQTGGCKSVASFQTNAAPELKSRCLNCHDTGGSGFGALDLSALAGATPNFAKACGQAKSRIDTASPATSSLIVAPTGGVATHPLKNAPATYRTAVTTWINAEK